MSKHSLLPDDTPPDGSPAQQQTVRDVMKRPTTTIEAGAHLAAAAYLMKHAHDSSLVVVNDITREPVSVITEADIARAISQERNIEDTRVHDVVRYPPVTVEADAVATEAIRSMLAAGVQHLPVVEGGRLVGVVELADLAYLYLTPGPAAAEA